MQFIACGPSTGYNILAVTIAKAILKELDVTAVEIWLIAKLVVIIDA